MVVQHKKRLPSCSYDVTAKHLHLQLETQLSFSEAKVVFMLRLESAATRRRHTLESKTWGSVILCFIVICLFFMYMYLHILTAGTTGLVHFAVHKLHGPDWFRQNELANPYQRHQYHYRYVVRSNYILRDIWCHLHSAPCGTFVTAGDNLATCVFETAAIPNVSCECFLGHPLLYHIWVCSTSM